MDPSLVPDDVNLRTIGQAQAVGEAKYELDLYLRRRGDAAIKSNTDLIDKSTFYDDPHFNSQKAARENADKPLELNTAERMLRRFSVQQMILQCMQEQNLDALVYPTNSVPPLKIGAPSPPPVNGRNSNTVWTFLGSQGFPAITVPAGFTTVVYDRSHSGEIAGGCRLSRPTLRRSDTAQDRFGLRSRDQASHGAAGFRPGRG